MNAAKPKPAAFDAKAFLEFCRSKPEGETYESINPRTCALAQFGYVDCGRSDAQAAGIPDEVYNAIFRPMSERHLPNTFGKLTARLEALAS